MPIPPVFAPLARLLGSLWEGYLRQRGGSTAHGLPVCLANLAVDLLTEDGEIPGRNDPQADNIVLDPGDPHLDVVANHHAFTLTSAEYQHLRVSLRIRPADQRGCVPWNGRLSL